MGSNSIKASKRGGGKILQDIPREFLAGTDMYSPSHIDPYHLDETLQF